MCKGRRGRGGTGAESATGSIVRSKTPFNCPYFAVRRGVSPRRLCILRIRLRASPDLCEGGSVTVALEEKYDQVRQLIAMGKERGYLLYDEVNDILPPEVHSSEEIDDLLSTFERYGIDVYEDLSSAKAALAAADPAEPTEVVKDEPASEDGELDLTPGTLEKTNDPVRMYLREMGTVPLLTR